MLNAAGLNRQRTPHQVQMVCARGDSRPVVESHMASWLCRGAGQIRYKGPQGAMVQLGMTVMAYNGAAYASLSCVRCRFYRPDGTRVAVLGKSPRHRLADGRLGSRSATPHRVLVFRLPGSRQLFLGLNAAVLALLDSSKSGTRFLLGPLAANPGEPGSIGFILAFQVLPVVIFFSAFTAVLYHLRLLQPVVWLFARIFHRTLGISGAEALYGASQIFVGIESALMVRPYLERMTRSEFLMLLTTGMCNVASSTLGLYVAFLQGVFPHIAGHLLSASVLSIPAGVVMAKIFVPETQVPETLSDVPPEDPTLRSSNLMAAIIAGATDGLKLAGGIAALLIAMLGLVALIDRVLMLPSAWLSLPQPLTLATMFELGVLSGDRLAWDAAGRCADGGAFAG